MSMTSGNICVSSISIHDDHRFAPQLPKREKA